MRRIFLSFLILFLGIPVWGAIAETSDQQAMIAKAMEAQTKILRRDYEGSLRIFKELEEEYPRHPVGPFGKMGLWVMRMQENETFEFDREYFEAAEKGIALMDQLPGQKKELSEWDMFILSAGYGIHGFYHSKKHEWWKAYVFGNKAKQFLMKLIWKNPKFYDAYMGLGMYKYYRSVFTNQLWYFPFYPDRREEGINDLKLAVAEGEYSPDLSAANLGLIYLREKRFKEAGDLFKPLVKKFPKNIILRISLGRAYLMAKQYKLAVREFETVLKVDSKNKLAPKFIRETEKAEKDNRKR